MSKFTIDKVEWQYKSAEENYCREKNKSIEDLNDKDEHIIWEYGANHIAFFLTWLIDNDLLSKLHVDNVENIQLVKTRKMTGFEYLEKHCDLVLSREDMAKKIVKFVDYCYDNIYISNDGYCGYMEKALNKVVLGTCFDWADYEAVRTNVIDVMYDQYLENKKKTSFK